MVLTTPVSKDYLVRWSSDHEESKKPKLVLVPKNSSIGPKIVNRGSSSLRIGDVYIVPGSFAHTKVAIHWCLLSPEASQVSYP